MSAVGPVETKHVTKRSRRLRRSTFKTIAAVLCLGGLGAGVTFAQCPMEWATGYEIPGVRGGYQYGDGPYSVVVFDDGTGPALYVAGGITYAGSTPVDGVARWDGQRWSAVGEPGWWDHYTPYVLTVFDDGTGPALYVGAGGGVMKWDGQRWNVIGGDGGPTHGVLALQGFDDGSGPALYAGLYGVPGVVRWNGHEWATVGGGMLMSGNDPLVDAFQVYDDGDGAKLYAGGRFSRAGDVQVACIARWDGAAWAGLTGGGTEYTVKTLTVHDDGTGPALYVGGAFLYAGGLPAEGVAKWDRNGWTAMSGDFVGGGGHVNALGWFDDGGGPALYAGGAFGALHNFARWDGTSWHAVAGGAEPSEVRALAVYAPPGGSPGLYLTGDFNVAGDVGCTYVARWDGQRYSSLGNGRGLAKRTRAACYFDDGSGPSLYVGGDFVAAGTVPARYIARWTEAGWAALLSDAWGWPPEGPVSGLTVFDDGSGPTLFVSAAPYVLKWDGHRWADITGTFAARFYTFCAFDDGTGPGLYCGGETQYIPGVGSWNIAKWDGTRWSALDRGLNHRVWGSAVFDDGHGPALYVCGEFDHTNGPYPPPIQLNHVARWDGHAWSDVGGGITNGSALALLVYDDGSGPALYMGGGFTSVGGTPANNIARWNGTSWEAVGGGTDPGVNGLASFDDGSGTGLYAAGSFTVAGGQPAPGVARWKNGAWSALGDGVRFGAWALASGTISGRPALFTVGGGITTAGGHASSNFAIWRCVENWQPGDLNCDGAVDWRDVDPFVLAISDPAGYAAHFPNCDLMNGDINDDGLVNFADIDPFVALLSYAAC